MASPKKKPSVRKSDASFLLEGTRPMARLYLETLWESHGGKRLPKKLPDHVVEQVSVSVVAKVMRMHKEVVSRG